MNSRPPFPMSNDPAPRRVTDLAAVPARPGDSGKHGDPGKQDTPTRHDAPDKPDGSVTHAVTHDEPAKHAEPSKPAVIEVELLRKYRPTHLVDDDGNIVEQQEGSDPPPVVYPPGTVLKLPREEAIYVMRHHNRIARISEQAY